MRILVVEDEPKTTQFLYQGLTESGFDVEVARQGDDGLRRALAGNFDLLVLDVMLPRRDGWSILTETRRQGRRTPALFLTARDSIADRVKGLELGADDYLVKPFAFSELLARIRSILRRSGEQAASLQSTEVLRVADLEIDLVRRRAARGRARLELTPTEFALLAFLVRRQGETLSRALRADQVWDVRSVGASNVVDVHVRRLRAKLDDPFPKRLIHTVRGAGYVLEARP
jgi:two-component system copper resistance phosphate regulon response regulator CusR